MPSAAVITSASSVNFEQCKFKGNGYTFRGDNSIKTGLVPFWKGVFYKRKEFAPPCEQIFALKSRPLLRRGLHESKQEVTKAVSLVKNKDKMYQIYTVPLRTAAPGTVIPN